jgi:hypothetical protein
LLPVGYDAGVAAYRRAVSGLSSDDLTHHYTNGLRYFRQQVVPYLKEVLSELTGGAWDLRHFHAYAAGSDADFMTNLVSAVADNAPVKLYPGDWFGFRVGVADPRNIVSNADGGGALACLCIPSVRNGHVTPEMIRSLHRSDACLQGIRFQTTVTRTRTWAIWCSFPDRLEHSASGWYPTSCHATSSRFTGAAI